MKGGYVHWLIPTISPTLLCLQMYSQPLCLSAVISVVLRGWRRVDKRITGIWMMPGIPLLLRVSLAFWARAFGLEIKELSFKEKTIQDCSVRLLSK